MRASGARARVLIDEGAPVVADWGTPVIADMVAEASSTYRPRAWWAAPPSQHFHNHDNNPVTARAQRAAMLLFCVPRTAGSRAAIGPSIERGFALLRKLKLLAVGGTVLCASTAFATPALAGTLSGAGSTLVAPLEAEWAQAFQTNTGNTVNYQAVGSGTGIKDISSGLVDFGASDAPLTSSQRSTCDAGHDSSGGSGPCVQIPWALGATGVGYNVPGVSGLKLSGPVMSAIFLGQITNWNDQRIARLNPGASLPNLRITTVYRSDGSGDTYAFTDYLQAVSPAWRARVGRGTAVQFPVGVGAKGNSGVTQTVQGTQGAIGYIAVSYLIAHGVPPVKIRNRAGNFVYPNLSNIQAAASSVHSAPANNEYHIVNPPASAKIAYPISTFTYVIVHQHAGQGGLLRQFINYALTGGQQFGPGLDFARLPTVVLRKSKADVSNLG